MRNNKLVFFLLFWSLNVCAELTPSSKYDWSTIINIPPGADLTEGSQILHFKSKNKHFTLDKKAIEFVNKHLKTAKKVNSDADLLRYASSMVTIQDGSYLETGVGVGRTINFIAALNPEKKVYGFDSLEGLPKDWVRDDYNFKKGTFAYKNPNIMPQLLNNVVFYKGKFEIILPKFVDEILQKRPIAFLHIDSEIYESAQTALSVLDNNLVAGSIIVFDEFYNYPGYESHEFKAFNEFLAKKKLRAKMIAYNQNHEQVAIKLIK